MDNKYKMLYMKMVRQLKKDMIFVIKGYIHYYNFISKVLIQIIQLIVYKN